MHLDSGQSGFPYRPNTSDSFTPEKVPCFLENLRRPRFRRSLLWFWYPVLIIMLMTRMGHFASFSHWHLLQHSNTWHLELNLWQPLRLSILWGFLWRCQWCLESSGFTTSHPTGSHLPRADIININYSFWLQWTGPYKDDDALNIFLLLYLDFSWKALCPSKSFGPYCCARYIPGITVTVIDLSM